MMTKNQMELPRAVSRADWLVSRQELLTKEKEFTRQHDLLSARRRQLRKRVA